MTIQYGMTDQGLVTKSLETVSDEVDGDLQTMLGASAGTNPDKTIPAQSMAGQLKTLVVDPFAAFWDLLPAVVANFDPNQASGVGLDLVCSMTGVTRAGDEFSTVVMQCTGDPGTVLIPKRVAKVAVTGSRFDTDAQATIAAVAAWINAHGYIVGDRMTSSGNVYQCITAGTSASVTAPSATTSDVTDGSVHWVYLGAGTGVVDVPATAEVAGAIGALAGTLTSIATPIAGWRGVYNVADAHPGELIEPDSTLRARRDASLSPSAEATAEAIRTRVLRVGQGTNNPVTSCRVFFNDTDVTDANGLTPHSIKVVVEGGPDDTTPSGLTSDPTASIAAALWSVVDAGTAMLGATTVSVIDSQGFTQTVAFQRPAPEPIYISLTANYDPTLWPTVGTAALVQQAAISAILTYFAGWLPGISVRSQPIGGAVKFGPSATDGNGTAIVPAPAGSLPAPGIVEVTNVFISTAPVPTVGTTIAITPFQLATFDSSRITVTATPEAP